MLRKISLDFVCIIFLLALSLLYFHHGSRDIFGGDVGDLTTAACVGGVPHPPGFPLFSMLGYGFCQMSHVFPFAPTQSVGFISLLAGVLGVGVYYQMAKRISSQSVALFSSCVLAFSYLYWLYSELAEVFVLNVFFALALFFLAEKYRRTHARRDFLLLCFIAGLSTTNHQTIIFVFPSIFILIAHSLWNMRKDWKTLLLGIVCVLLGFSVYGYSVIASLRQPALDWAHITNFQSFIEMILRKRYGTFSAGVFEAPSSEGTLIILIHYFKSLISQITFPGFLLCLIGIDRVIKEDKIKALSYAVAFILTGPLFFGYAGFPLNTYFHAGVSERFLLLSTGILLLFLPYGCKSVIQGFLRFFPRPSYSILLQCVLFLIPFLLFIYNFPKTDLSTLTYGDQLGMNFLRPLPQNSVVLMDGDTTLFNTWYVHLVLNYRPDVTVVNMYSMYDSPYYMKKQAEAKKKFPHLTDDDIHMQTMLLIDKERPFFSRVDLQPDGKNVLRWSPYGLVHELHSPDEPEITIDEYISQSERVWKQIILPDIRHTNNIAAKSLTIADIPNYYANSLLATGSYFQSTLKNRKYAYQYYEKAREVDPEYARTYAVLGVYFTGEKETCKKGISLLEQAIAMRHTNALFYFHLYTAYRVCNQDVKKISALKTTYKTYFNSSLEQDLKTYIEKPEKQDSDTL